MKLICRQTVKFRALSISVYGHKFGCRLTTGKAIFDETQNKDVEMYFSGVVFTARLRLMTFVE